MQPSTSPAGSLNQTDYFKSLRGAALTFVAGIAVELLVEVERLLQVCRVSPDQCAFNLNGYDFVLPAAIAICGLALELLRRYATNHERR